MENQHPSQFPFDALELPDDVGAGDLFPPLVAATPDARAALLDVRRQLEDVAARIRIILTALDRALAGSASHTTFGGGAADERAVPRGMSYERPLDPVPGGIQRDDANSLRVIEGVFDGQNMVGPDGKHYSVSANYASKSKLVEGDILKLTITNRGAFVYKQIGPIARDRAIGVIERDDVTGEYVVLVPEQEEDRASIARAIADRADLPTVPYKRYRTLRASVTYYRGEPGDEAVMIVPQGTPSTWAAVENIIKR